MDSPRSRRKAPPNQRMNCSGSGRSRFRRARIASTCDGVALSPASRTAGSPGVRCRSEKMNTDTNRSVGMEARSLESA